MQKKKHDQLRIRDTLKDLHIQIQKENKSKTPKELGMHEKFEDVPDRLSDRDKIGRVNKVSTSTIQHMRGGGTFDD
jgi:hypothetical protein|tara:strand:+ start:501 stop:728 length:228 start_codon:yes stop_codon:yes gene_type:complete